MQLRNNFQLLIVIRFGQTAPLCTPAEPSLSQEFEAREFLAAISRRVDTSPLNVRHRGELHRGRSQTNCLIRQYLTLRCRLRRHHAQFCNFRYDCYFGCVLNRLWVQDIDTHPNSYVLCFLHARIHQLISKQLLSLSAICRPLRPQGHYR